MAKQYDARVHYTRPHGVIVARGYPYSPTVSYTNVLVAESNTE